MAARSFGFAIRQFSTSGSKLKLVQPPLVIFGTEGRYATALYSAATKNNKLTAVEKDLKEFSNLLKTDARLNEFISDPTLKIQLKKEALMDVMKKKNATDLTTNFMAVLADNGRFDRIGAVCNAFARIMSAYRGEVSCEVTSAKPLDPAYLKELETALKSFLKKEEVLHLSTKVDPSLIGGLVVSIGDKYVDMSMATKIKTYSNIIQQAI